ncbi:uncharacterized protein LOC144034197 [Vanacampus margaritifer]
MTNTAQYLHQVLLKTNQMPFVVPKLTFVLFIAVFPASILSLAHLSYPAFLNFPLIASLLPPFPSFTASSSVFPSSTFTSSSSFVKPHVEAGEAKVRLLPPLLKDQAWRLHAHEAFLLFCLALAFTTTVDKYYHKQQHHEYVEAAAILDVEQPKYGPSDTHIDWLINGRRADTAVTEYRLPLVGNTVLVSSRLRTGPLPRDARYGCVAQAGAGSDASQVDLHLAVGDEESAPSGDLNQWRSALTQHEQLLKRWEKSWESCDGH